jgi:hypothetical protein
MKLDHHLVTFAKVKSRLIKNRSLKSKTIQHLENSSTTKKKKFLIVGKGYLNLNPKKINLKEKIDYIKKKLKGR